MLRQIAMFEAGPSRRHGAGHRADERLPLEDLAKATQVVALTLYDLLAAQG